MTLENILIEEGFELITSCGNKMAIKEEESFKVRLIYCAICNKIKSYTIQKLNEGYFSEKYNLDVKIQLKEEFITLYNSIFYSNT